MTNKTVKLATPTLERNPEPVQLNRISMAYGSNVLYEQFSLRFQPRGVSFILGPNGAGKTQLLKMIHTLTQPQSGYITAPDISQQAYLQQQPTLLNRTVKQNINFIQKSANAYTTDFKFKLEKVVNQLKLANKLNQNVNTLSGGERKRVAMARLLLQNATLYLLDEPSANVDLATNKIIESVIADLANTNRKVLLTLHDLTQLNRLFTPGRDEIIILNQGQPLQRKTSLDLPQLIEILSTDPSE